MTFRQLSVGDNFEFDRKGFEYSGMASGPWTKIGTRTYVKAGDTPGRYTTLRVGSVSVKVVKQNPHTVSAKSVLKAGKSILARVKRVGNNLVIQPVERAVRKARKAVKRTTRRNPDAKRGQYTVEVGSQHWFVMKGGLQAALKKGVREAGAGGHFYVTDGVSARTRHFKVNDRNKVQEIK